MMTFDRYRDEDHAIFAKHLIASRTLDGDWFYDLPEHGIVAFENNNVVGMGFLRLVEGGGGMIDSYITEPTELPSSRNFALNGITFRLIQIARELSIKRLFAFSTDKNTLERAHNYGFVKSGYELIGLDLIKEEKCHF